MLEKSLKYSSVKSRVVVRSSQVSFPLSVAVRGVAVSSAGAVRGRAQRSAGPAARRGCTRREAVA